MIVAFETPQPPPAMTLPVVPPIIDLTTRKRDSTTAVLDAVYGRKKLTVDQVDVAKFQWMCFDVFQHSILPAMLSRSPLSRSQQDFELCGKAFVVSLLNVDERGLTVMVNLDEHHPLLTEELYRLLIDTTCDILRQFTVPLEHKYGSVILMHQECLAIPLNGVMQRPNTEWTLGLGNGPQNRSNQVWFYWVVAGSVQVRVKLWMYSSYEAMVNKTDAVAFDSLVTVTGNTVEDLKFALLREETTYRADPAMYAFEEIRAMTTKSFRGNDDQFELDRVVKLRPNLDLPSGAGHYKNALKELALANAEQPMQDGSSLNTYNPIRCSFYDYRRCVLNVQAFGFFTEPRSTLK